MPIWGETKTKDKCKKRKVGECGGGEKGFIVTTRQKKRVVPAKQAHTDKKNSRCGVWGGGVCERATKMQNKQNALWGASLRPLKKNTVSRGIQLPAHPPPHTHTLPFYPPTSPPPSPHTHPPPPPKLPFPTPSPSPFSHPFLSPPLCKTSRPATKFTKKKFKKKCTLTHTTHTHKPHIHTVLPCFFPPDLPLPRLFSSPALPFPLFGTKPSKTSASVHRYSYDIAQATKRTCVC